MASHDNKCRALTRLTNSELRPVRPLRVLCACAWLAVGAWVVGCGSDGPQRSAGATSSDGTTFDTDLTTGGASASGSDTTGGANSSADGADSENPDIADPSNSLEVGSLEDDTALTYAPPGLIIDSRDLPLSQSPKTGAEDCSNIAQFTYARQRSTLGQGVQVSVGLVKQDGSPLSSAANQDCVALSDLLDVPLETGATSASATNALTLILAQPGGTEAEQQQIRDAAKRLFLSRPQGERLALFSWGETIDQVTTFTTFYDTFADAVDQRFPAAEVSAPLDAVSALQQAYVTVADVVDDGHLWVRSVVAIAPELSSLDLPTQLAPQANALWIVGDTAGTESSLVFDASNLPSAISDTSEALDEFRREGFVTLGTCASDADMGAKIMATSGTASLEVTLKNALPEEMTGACDPQTSAEFSFYDTKLVEMLVEAESASLYEDLVRARNKDDAFAASMRWSPEHELAPATVHLRGSSSLSSCDANRLGYTVNLDSGRERFLISESDGALGSDEFFLISMCLDRMYLNQFTANRLLKRVGVFIPGQKLVELRVNGETQGVYLLMENMKEALIRSNSRVLSVLRRKNSIEVKFPDATDTAGVEQALADYQELAASIAGLPGDERLSILSQRLDLHRHMSYVAMESMLNNVDWGTEPFFVSTETIGSAGTQPFFSVQSWDQDDLFLGDCAHSAAVPDVLGLVGCVEDPLERTIFGAATSGQGAGGGMRQGGGNSADVVDDEVYALYVDVLENMMDIFSEDVVGAAFDETARQLKSFASDPAVVAVMPDWSGSDDIEADIEAALSDRKAAFAAHQQLLRDNLAAYRALHASADTAGDAASADGATSSDAANAGGAGIGGAGIGGAGIGGAGIGGAGVGGTGGDAATNASVGGATGGAGGSTATSG